MKKDGDGENWRGRSLPIRAGVVITAVGMGRECGSPRMRGIGSKHAAA